MTALSKNDLYKTLKDLDVIENDSLDLAFKETEENVNSFIDALITRDLISDENLGKLVAENLHLSFVVLSKLPIKNIILKTIPESSAKINKSIAFGADKTDLKVATCSPDNPEFFQMLEQKVNRSIKVFYATSKDIEDTFRLYKKELQKTFDDMLNEAINEADQAASKEAPVAKIINTLIEYAYQNKASDIHIEPEDEDSVVRFRVDGVLSDVLKLPKELHDQVITRIKVMARLRTDEHLSAQDGKMQLEMESEDLDIRVSIVPIVDGEKAVLRLLSEKSRQFSLSDLGMSDVDLKKVRNGFTKPYGMVLSTGPTGSGKTTTMYAILKILNTRDKNISTIEDPVEYEMEGINQIQVNPKTNLTFADGLRSILRQDPDTIFVGEIRDKETAGIAINSAMTGHMVLSTLHTNDAATALPRLIDMDIEPFLVSSTVNVIIAQRLVRKVCEKCKVSFITKPEELQKQLHPELISKFFPNQPEIRLYKGKGCSVCHRTGYLGRIGVFEILEVSAAIKELIDAKTDSDTIAKKAIEEGMTTMTDDGLAKVRQGLTTIEEVLRATKE